MTTAIEYPDLELWAAGYLRAGLASWSATVGREFPAPGATFGYAVVVRDDSGADQQFTASRLLAVTVIGPGGEHYQAGRCAERVAALLRISAGPGADTPVARCRSVRGPYAVPSNTGRPELYLTADLIVTGSPITL